MSPTWLRDGDAIYPACLTCFFDEVGEAFEQAEEVNDVELVDQVNLAPTTTEIAANN
jgi:hypothetical protein